MQEADTVTCSVHSEGAVERPRSGGLALMPNQLLFVLAVPHTEHTSRIPLSARQTLSYLGALSVPVPLPIRTHPHFIASSSHDCRNQSIG